MAGTRTQKAAADGPAVEPGTPDLTGADPLVGVAVGVAERVDGTPQTAEEQRAAIQKEYGQYVATQAITHGGVLAYNVNDPVPAANVERWGYLKHGLVRATGAVVASPAEEPDHTNDDPND